MKRYRVEALNANQVGINLNVGQRLDIADDGTVSNEYGSVLFRLAPAHTCPKDSDGKTCADYGIDCPRNH